MSAKSRKVVIVAAFLGLLVSGQVYAEDCTGFQSILSPHRLSQQIFQGTVTGFTNNNEQGDPGSLHDDMHVLVTEVYWGFVKSGETVRVDGGSSAALSDGFPVGSNWIFGIFGNGGLQPFPLDWCDANLSVNDGQVSGYIRDYNCHRQGGCEPTPETMGLGAFEDLIRNYYQAVHQAVTLCSWHEIESYCPDRVPKFVAQDKKLILPYVEIYTANPSGESSLNWYGEALLELLGGNSDGELRFKLLEVKSESAGIVVD